MNEPEEPKTVKKTVSLPAELQTRGQARARAQQRTFSSYIQHLIAKDVEAERAGAETQAA